MLVRTCWIVLALASAGCKGELNPAYCATHEDPRCPDGGTPLPNDGMVDLDSFVNPEAGAQTCFGATGSAYEICLDSLPTSAVNISGTIGTDSSLCFPTQPTDWTGHGQPDACFIIGTDVTITNTAHAQGNRPLVVLATGAIDVQAALDVSSKRGQPTGGGHDSALCAAFAQTPANANNGGGGGAGGSFMSKGGDAGFGNTTGNQPGLAAEADTLAPVVLRGGCPGQMAGNGDQNAGSPGGGAGAMYLVAGHMIVFENNGALAASGAGGSGGGHHSGGSGGGSGGMIMLHAGDGFTVSTNAKLIAAGGAAAGGIAQTGGGQNGGDGSSTNATSIANGGGNGGDGYPAIPPANDGANGGSNTGGGGGGGGAGYIEANQPLTLMASPAITVVP